MSGYAQVRNGQKLKSSMRANVFRFAFESRHHVTARGMSVSCLPEADMVGLPNAFS